MVQATVEVLPDTADVANSFAIVVPIATAGGKVLGAGSYRHVFVAVSTADRDAWTSALER